MGRRTLVVDADSTVRDSVATALRIARYTMDTASTRTDALALIERHRYGLILSNLRMPELDGPTLYQNLERRSPKTPSDIIFITDSRHAPDYPSFLMEVGAPRLAKRSRSS